ncbi:allophanate hydrolase subunit 1 [uncultured Sphaerotilus sp.]|uniref:5-oxoprolinase subunit B family protein n=1 Tax=uncultured Sphaerotilus sp. TaxID=474984 RepID=UPI0030CA2218
MDAGGEGEGASAWPPATLLPLGDAAWTVEFGDVVDPVLQARVLALAEKVQALRGSATQEAAVLAGVLDVVPTFRSLTVVFDPLRTDADALGQRLLAWSAADAASAHPGRRWQLPVCCAPAFAPDLVDLSAACGLTDGAVVALLTSTLFRVGMIGFMPGFPYMTGLPPALALPRLASPRRAVPAGSLAVAGALCCVYPWESPGGWRLLGHMPLPLFDLAQTSAPAWLAAGDEVRWTAVEATEHGRLAADWARGALGRQDFLDTGEEAPWRTR